MASLTLAVAGSWKTQSIVDECVSLPAEQRGLVLTYTASNQAELLQRFAGMHVAGAQTEVMGWFGFLIKHWVRPYLPLLYDQVRVKGFSFDGPDGDSARFLTGIPLYFTPDGSVYRRHLAKLAWEVNAKSRGAIFDRLSRLYDVIYIDEAQDLCGWDLELLLAMIDAGLELRLVGDTRQALLATDERGRKHKKYKYNRIRDWFLLQEKRKRLQITYKSQTWRCNAEIAAFSDSIFGPDAGFPRTESMMLEASAHRGVFAIGAADVSTYIARYKPLCLRQSANSWREFDEGFTTFGQSKGCTVDHVLICATAKIEAFAIDGSPLDNRTACGLYVAATRAKHSVAIVMKDPQAAQFAHWYPS